MGEGEGGIIWENGIETCILYVKWIASPGLMHETGCSGLVHWDDPEGWDGEGGGRQVQDGEHMYMYIRGRFMSMYGNLPPQKKGVRELYLWMVELDLKFRPQTHLLYLKSGLCSYITQLPEDFCKTYCIFSKRCFNWRRKCIPVQENTATTLQEKCKNINIF